MSFYQLLVISGYFELFRAILIVSIIETERAITGVLLFRPLFAKNETNL